MTPTDQPAAIAVVGLACRVPGADDADGFAELLYDGRQQFIDVPEARMPGYDPEWTGLKTIRAALLDRPDLFDAAFFGITPRMAAWMDPQQYQLLEMSWRALESAAIPPDRLSGSDTGVYMATTSTDFRDRSVGERVMNRYSILGASSAFLANRISFQLDLCGPSITLDAACAGGLTAVTMSVAALRSGDVDLAIAGAVNMLVFGYMHGVMVSMGAVSRTGSPRCFDDSADGYVRGEGVFVFVLKRLADAIADNDPIHGVIYGSAMTHDGRAGGLTRTDSQSQQRLISRALRQAGAGISDVGYVEAHAAGSPLGDIAEMTTLRQMLEQSPGGTPPRAAGPDGTLWLGSVKANIGHLEGAAGAASLMKALLVLKHGAIPPTPGFRTLHREIELRGMPLAVADRVMPWSVRPGKRRLIGVDSFGVGGSNAHVVVGDGPERAVPAPGPDGEWLVPVSADTPAALAQLAGALADRLAGADPAPFPAVVRTLQHGRTHLRHRRIVRANGVAELSRGLRSLAGGRPHPQVVGSERGGDGLGPELDTWLLGEHSHWPASASAPDVPRVSLTPYPFQWRSHWQGRERPPAITPPHLAARRPVGGAG